MWWLVICITVCNYLQQSDYSNVNHRLKQEMVYGLTKCICFFLTGEVVNSNVWNVVLTVTLQRHVRNFSHRNLSGTRNNTHILSAIIDT